MIYKVTLHTDEGKYDFYHEYTDYDAAKLAYLNHLRHIISDDSHVPGNCVLTIVERDKTLMQFVRSY